VSGPKYQQIADAVLAKIASGEVGGEITLGRVRELTGTTDATSRKAVAELVSAGILESHPGAPYTVRITAKQASAARLDDRPLKDQVAELRREVADLRQKITLLSGDTELAQRIGRIEANLVALYGNLGREYPRGGRRERAKAAAGGGR
jgi:DNA-binding transcriptional regulator YhcF (GntR family)